MDNAKVSSQHWKIMLISGMGFFTDAMLRRQLVEAFRTGHQPLASFTEGLFRKVSEVDHSLKRLSGTVPCS
jgi:hypothetical protein